MLRLDDDGLTLCDNCGGEWNTSYQPFHTCLDAERAPARMIARVLLELREIVRRLDAIEKALK